MTPDEAAELRALATAIEAAADVADRAGQRGLGTTLLKLALKAHSILNLDAAMPPPRLTVKQPPTTVRDVNVATRKAISRGLGTANVLSGNMDAAREAKIPSMRALAKKLGVSVSFISQVMSGLRPMPETLAIAFKKLTGKDWQ